MKCDSSQSFMWFCQMSRLHWPELSLVEVCLSAVCSLDQTQLDTAGLSRANGDEAEVFLCKLRWSSTLPALFHYFGSLFNSYLDII